MTTAGLNAEYGQAAGGIFNFVTKSGGNSFHGTGNFHLQDKALESSNISDELRRQGVTAATSVNHVYDWGGNLGGPVPVRNKLWFFQSYHKFEQEQSQTDFLAPIAVRQWQMLSKITAQLSDTSRLGRLLSVPRSHLRAVQLRFRTCRAIRRTWTDTTWKNDALTVN